MKQLHSIFADVCRSGAAFVEKHGSRYDLARPWIDGGYIYATDAMFAVRRRLGACELPTCTTNGAIEIGGLFSVEAARTEVAVPDTELAVCDSCFSGCDQCWWTCEAVAENQIIAGRIFSAKSVTLLRRHGIKSLWLCDDDHLPPKCPTDVKPARFVIDDCEGLVMPMIPKGEL
jgi:hypothetical protein